MADLSVAVQKAVYTALQGLSAPVYDDVEPDAAYPYIAIDAVDTAQNDYLASEQQILHVYLSIWSDYKGKKEVLGIQSEIHTALHRQRLAMEQGAMIACDVIRKRAQIDADGTTYMGGVTIKITAE